jgi:hypothetical protein
MYCLIQNCQVPVLIHIKAFRTRDIKQHHPGLPVCVRISRRSTCTPAIRYTTTTVGYVATPRVKVIPHRSSRQSSNCDCKLSFVYTRAKGTTPEPLLHNYFRRSCCIFETMPTAGGHHSMKILAESAVRLPVQGGLRACTQEVLRC